MHCSRSLPIPFSRHRELDSAVAIKNLGAMLNSCPGGVVFPCRITVASAKAWQEAEQKKLAKSKRMLDRQLRANASFTERGKERQELEEPLTALSVLS